MKISAAALCLTVLCGGCLGNPAGDSPKFHIINLSLPRTASTSFTGIFDQYGSTHEFMISKTVNALLDYGEKKVSAEELQSFLKDRDKKAGHSVDSATFFFLSPELVIDTFPDARFFLSVRACEPWIVSMVDNSVFAHKMIVAGKATVDLSFLDRYSNQFIENHSREMFLDMRNLRKFANHIVTNLAKAWSKYTLRTLEAMLKVRRENRLIIRTEDFSKSMNQIARLAGVSAASLNLRNIHMNKDRDLTYFRNILGVKLLKAASELEQKKVEIWLENHAQELR